MSPYAGYLVETSVTLLAVCALAVAVLWGARRLGLGRPTGPIALVGHLPLDARRAVYLVRVGDRVLVLGTGEGGLSKLGEVPASDLSGEGGLEPPGGSTAFARVLAGVRGGKGAP